MTLTKRQQEVLNLLHNKDLWRPPSIETIRKKLNVASTAGVHKHLHALVKKGAAEHKNGHYFPL